MNVFILFAFSQIYNIKSKVLKLFTKRNIKKSFISYTASNLWTNQSNTIQLSRTLYFLSKETWFSVYIEIGQQWDKNLTKIVAVHCYISDAKVQKEDEFHQK